MPAANVPGTISGQCSASGETRWIPEGEFLAAPAVGEAAVGEAAVGEAAVGEAALGEAGSRGGWPAVRWLEFSAGSGAPVRVKIPSPAAVPTGTAEPPWPTPAECYLDQLAWALVDIPGR